MAYIKEGSAIIGVPEPKPYPLYEKGTTLFDTWKRPEQGESK